MTSWIAPSLTFLDPLAAVLVAVPLLRASWTIKPILHELMETGNPQLIEQVHDKVEVKPEVKTVY